MPPTVEPDRAERYDAYKIAGYSRKAAAAKAGVSYDWATKRDKGHPNSGDGYRQSKAEAKLPAPIPFADLSDEAWEALWDDRLFARRYMGKDLTPFQLELCALLEAAYESEDREYVIVNAPPGGGKTTSLQLKAAQWTARDRSLRGLFISRAQSLATRNLLAVRRLLSRVTPAIEADACMAKDYGRFKPDSTGDVWKRDEIVVVQMDGSPIEEKEPTWSAFGFDSEYLGNRFTISLGDDLDSTRSISTAEVIQRNRTIYDDELEPRLEPGGVMVNCQQRLSPNDMTAHCLSKMLTAEDEDDEPTPQYSHIKFRAHYDERCRGKETHHLDAPPYDGTEEGGCLLDPRRLSWKDLRKVMGNRQRFEVVYQQEDVDPEDVLVHPIWVSGGTGPDGVEYVGCWDSDRALCEVPYGVSGLSYVTVDPSPTKMWGVIWWLYDPVSERRYLLDLEKRKYSADEFLSYNPLTSAYEGLAPAWQARSVDLGVPISVWIVEKTGVNHYLLQRQIDREWFPRASTSLLAHDTQRNKADPHFGIQTIAPVFKYGRVRLPGSQRGEGRFKARKLVDEVTRYPDITSDDLMHSMWFGEFNLPHLLGSNDTPTFQRRPSWLRVA